LHANKLWSEKQSDSAHSSYGAGGQYQLTQ
jgi:hypothetical protein